MESSACDVLLGWLALPIPTDLVASEYERLETAAGSADTAAPFLRRLLGVAVGIETPRPAAAPANDVERAIDLLGRGERAVLETDRQAWQQAAKGQSVQPSAAVLSIAGDLDALARSSSELRAAGLSGPLAAQAAAWMFAHSTEHLAPSAQAMLRSAVSGLAAGIPRRALGQAFAALSQVCAAQGRADLWQAQVQHLMDAHPDSVPFDLAWWVALLSEPVIMRDSRWFRAAKSRAQAEQLLDLRHDAQDPDHPDRLDVVRVGLGEAYLLNRDLDEEPWIVTADKVAHDLLGRVGAAGVEQLLGRFTTLVVRSGAPAPDKARLVRSWQAVAEERGVLHPEMRETLEEALQMIEAPLMPDADRAESDAVMDADSLPDADVEVDAEVGGTAVVRGVAADELRGVPRGVPAGLYSEDPVERAVALEAEFGGWAFMTAVPEYGDEFFDAVPALTEMFTRGIADESERVREASAIFARRLAHGYYRRELDSVGQEWERRILAATHGLTSPKCARLRMQALWHTTAWDEDMSARAAAEQQLERELENNYADYAIVHRALLAKYRIPRYESGPQKIAALDELMELILEAIDNDEYESYDWSLEVLKTATSLVRERIEISSAARASLGRPETIDRENVDGLFRAMERYFDHVTLADMTEFKVELFGDSFLAETRPLVSLLGEGDRARAVAIVDRVQRMLSAHDPDAWAVMDAKVRLEEAAVVFRGLDDAARERGTEMFCDAYEYGVSLIDRGLGDRNNLAWRFAQMSDWAFRQAEAWESGTKDGRLRPYTLTTRLALAHLRHGFQRSQRDPSDTLNSFARMAAHPGCFLTSENPEEVREFYELLLPVLDPQRDGAETIAKAKQQAKQAQRLGKKRGWFK